MPGDSFFLSAFSDLNTCRPSAFDVAPIPWTTAREYATHHGLDADTFDIFWRVIREMDREYMLHEQEKRSIDA